jgi:hypothetical protein
MIPQILTEWNLLRLTKMLDQNIFEAETFDYKEFRIGKKSEPEKQDIRKDCCAFANSQGGFLVFGVSDNKHLSTNDRLIGLDKTFEFIRDFGDFPQECKPSVSWAPLNPPIDLPNGRVIHVIHVPQSWRGPHCISTEKPQEGFLYPKRTNKGNEYMNYEEVRMSFLGYYEKRLKLQLLKAELSNILTDADDIPIQDQAMGMRVPTLTFNLNVIESVLIDTYAITAHNTALVEALQKLRKVARQINCLIESLAGKAHTITSSPGRVIGSHNIEIIDLCKKIR